MKPSLPTFLFSRKSYRRLSGIALLAVSLLAAGCTTSPEQLFTAIAHADIGVESGQIGPDAPTADTPTTADPSAADPVATPILLARVQVDRLNVRAQPTVESAIVGKLLRDSEWEVLDQTDDGLWLRVQPEPSIDPGWIAAEYAQLIELAASPPAEATNTPEATDTAEESSAESDSAATAPEAVAPLPAPTVPTAYTQPDRMNVRGGPGTNYTVVATVETGTALPILGVSPDGQWFQVNVDGRDDPAWVFGNLTDTAGPMEMVAPVAEDEIPAPPAPQVALAQSAAAPVSAPLPSGAGFFGYGVQAHMLGGGIDAATNATANLGFNWIKQQVEWRVFEGSQGAVDFSELRRIVDAAGGRGISVLFSVVNAPDWAREPGFDASVGGPPADPQSYANFVGRMAGEFCGSGLKAIEIWNEQNLHYEWGNRPLNPADYMNLLRPAYASIKAACPSMLVISGALTPAGDAGPYARDDFAYLEGMYQNGLARYADGIGVHPSGFNVPPSVGWQQACATIQQTGNSFNGPCDTPHHSWSFRSTMEGYRNIMVVYGDTSKRLWPTEFGWAIGPAVNGSYAYANDNSAEEQAAWTVEAYQLMRSWGWVGPAFLWNLNFRVVADGTEKAQWGIVRNDYGPLPVYDALRNMPK